jgi:hypothetical protein
MAVARVRRAQKRKRIETVVNARRDLGCNARLPNLDELQAGAGAQGGLAMYQGQRVVTPISVGFGSAAARV